MTNAAKRKAEQRQRDKESGMVEIRFTVKAEHKQRMENAAQIAGYDLGELLALLGHKYAQKIEAAQESLHGKVCEHCGEDKSLTGKCAFNGMADCWMTVERKELLRVGL